MKLVPPDPQEFEGPGVLRWAVGVPAGPRSQTWNVVGHSSGGDVFVGLRDRVGEIKLSLHPARWRLAYTSEAAPTQIAPGDDRVILRWERPAPLAAGWTHALTITVAHSMLGPGFDERPVRGAEEVARFPSPGPGRALRFDLLLGDTAAEVLTINDAIGEVGRMELRDGTKVWVVASEFVTDESLERGLAEVRAKLRDLAEVDGTGRGWAWGSLDEDGAPSVLDISGV